MSNGPDSESGFTLVELLVSLALLSLMAVYAFDAYGVMRDMNRLASRYEDVIEFEQAIQHLRDEVGGTLTVLENDSNGQPRLVFKGEAHSLTFVTAANGDRETGGLYRVRYFVNDAHALVSERLMYRPGEDLPVYSVTLLRNVEEVLFRYGATASADDAKFVEVWNDPLLLPKAIELTIDHGLHPERNTSETVVFALATR